MVVLDSRKFTDKESSHDYLYKTLVLPDYYGKNLDALHDCLTEMKRKIVISNTSEAGAYYEALRPVFMDSAEENAGLEIIEQEGSYRRSRLLDKFKRKI